MKIYMSEDLNFISRLDHCCDKSRFAEMANDIVILPNLNNKSLEIYYKGDKISHCVFCGKRIEGYRDVEIKLLKEG